MCWTKTSGAHNESIPLLAIEAAPIRSIPVIASLLSRLQRLRNKTFRHITTEPLFQLHSYGPRTDPAGTCHLPGDMSKIVTLRERNVFHLCQP
jgi:hypothetical protein